MSNPDQISTAAALAKALDREDYESARQLLAEDCRYEIRGEVLEGADAIIESYRSNGDSGNERFDRVEYESAVEAIESGARINYTDRITKAGETHVHRCAQEVRANAEGLIEFIRHVDLEGEREALQAFCERHGV